MMEELRIITMRDVEAKEVEWLWNPYLPLGKLSIVQGDGDTGKTTMMLAIAAAVSTGAALPGGNPTEPAGVIIQTTENGLADTVKPKLELFGADCSRVHVIDDSSKRLTYADERIEEAIVRLSAKLVIFDPVQSYLGGANMHSAGDVRPLLNQIIEVAERTRCAVVVLGHLNKRGGAAQYRGLGSIDIFAAARSVLTVGKIPEDKNMRAVVHSKSNLATAGASFATGLDTDGQFVWLGDYDITVEELLRNRKPPESQFAKARRLIETKLKSGPVPAADMEEMAEEQGISAKTLHRAKSALGVVSVKRGGCWYWEMPIEVEFTVCEDDGQSGQGGHGGHDSPMAGLTALPPVDDGQQGQDGHGFPVTALTTFVQSEAV